MTVQVVWIESESSSLLCGPSLCQQSVEQWSLLMLYSVSWFIYKVNNELLTDYFSRILDARSKLVLVQHTPNNHSFEIHLDKNLQIHDSHINSLSHTPTNTHNTNTCIIGSLGVMWAAPIKKQRGGGAGGLALICGVGRMLSWHGTRTRLAVFVLYMTLRGFSDVLEQVCCIHHFPRPPPCVHFSIIVMLC